MNKLGIFLFGCTIGYLLGYGVCQYLLQKEQTDLESEFYEEVLVEEINGMSEPDPEDTVDNFKKKEELTINYNQKEESPPDDDPDILLITFDQFSKNTDGLNYDIETLTYYSGDSTLVGEDDQIAPSEENMVGDLLQHFGNTAKQTSGDSDVLYVRNHCVEVDYEVIRVPGRYAEQVLGIYKEDE